MCLCFTSGTIIIILVESMFNSINIIVIITIIIGCVLPVSPCYSVFRYIHANFVIGH
jgi:hypothetical protein